MEADLDKIADNKVNWVKITQNVYDATFHPTVVKLKNDTDIKKSYKEKDKSFRKIQRQECIIYVGRYGPYSIW